MSSIMVLFNSRVGVGMGHKPVELTPLDEFMVYNAA